MSKNETKLEKFERIAEKRTIEALKRIRLIRNLANKNNYDYTDQHVNKIISELRKEVDMLEKEFKSKSESGEINFKF